MKRIILYITLLLASLYIFSGTGAYAQAGADRQLSAAALWEDCERARSLCHYDTLLTLSTRLQSLASESGNERYAPYALFYQGLARLFTGQKDEAMRSLGEAFETAEEAGNDSVLALVTNAMGIYHAMTENNNFVAQQYFFRSLEYAEKSHYEQVKGRVYGNLLILTHADNDTTGLENAQNIYEYGKDHDDFEQTFMGAYYLAMYYNLKGENERAESYLDESLALYDRYRYDDVASVYTLYAKVKNDMGDRSGALSYAQRAIDLAKEYNQALLLPDAYLQYALILHDMGEYARSNEVAQQALTAVEQSSSRTKSIPCYQLIARNCQRLGMKDQALSYLERANNAMDTLARINMSRLRHEYDILSDINQKEQDARVRKQQMADQRKLNLLLIVATLVLAGLLAVIWVNYRRRNRLYKNIVIQNSHAITRHDELQSRIDKLEAILEEQQSNNAMEGETAVDAENPIEMRECESEAVSNDSAKPRSLVDDEERAQELYERACMLMEKERLFADPQLNRERFAELLGTNRTYLSKILKEKSGMTYLQFVNSHRINEAIRLLSDPNTQLPLKQIWNDLGFNSPATFYKQFQQAVGITPSVYRKQVMEVERLKD